MTAITQSVLHDHGNHPEIQIVCEEHQYCRSFNKSFEQDCTIVVSMFSSSEVTFRHLIDDTMTFSSSFFRRHSKLSSSSALYSNGYRLSHPSNDLLHVL